MPGRPEDGGPTRFDRIAVVDDANRFVRWEDRGTIHEQRLVHRSVHVMIFDGQGNLLVQRRHASKQTYHVEESDP